MLVGAAALVGLGAVWLIVTGLLMRSQLEDLDLRLGQVKNLVATGEVDKARGLAKEIPDMARRAHHLTTGPAWWAAASIPFLGEPLDVARGATAATEKICTDAVPQLLEVAGLIDPAALRVNGRTIRIDLLARAAPQLVSAAATLHDSTADIADLPSDTWLGVANDGREKLRSQLRSIQGYVDAAARVSKALPSMMGANGETRRYFIGLQNEAEMRGTGGLPGAFAIARVRNGTIVFEQFLSDAALLPAATKQQIATGLDFGASYDRLYGPGNPTEFIVNSNSSPHFPYAAQIWARMWEKVAGQHIDGAMAVDPTALSYFLAATGPTVLRDGTAVTAQNVVSLTQRDNYAVFSNNFERKNFLVSVFKAASNKLLSGVGRPYDIVKAASLSANEGRFLAYTENERTQKLIEQTNYAGAILDNGRPLSAVILNNAAAGKLDYYLNRAVAYTRTGCGARRDVIVTIELTNNAPATGLPRYVVRRGDRPPAGAVPGDNHTYLDYYATSGAFLQSVTLNGKRATASPTQTLGKAVFRMDLQLPRGTTQTVVLHLDEPAAEGRTKVWTQPGVNPLMLSVEDQKCG